VTTGAPSAPGTRFGPLRSLDIASGLALPGPRPARPTDGRERANPDRVRRLSTPRQALEAVIRPALLRPPCLVSFSGGRDSGAVLAVAATLARREGLPLPIPATNVVRAAPDADESAWQEMLIRHLGLTEWVRIEHDDELDLIGPYAQRVLNAHGLLWPANAHFHLPLLDAARDGSMLTGIGGDELYCAAQRPRAAAVLARQVPVRPRDVLSVGFAVAPRAVRRAVIARRSEVGLPWLRPPARRRVTAMLAAEAAAEPRALAERMVWWQDMRYLRIGAESIARIATQTSTLLVHPLLSSRFWSAVGNLAGPTGFAGRTEGVAALFGDLLPPEIIARSSKANFDRVFWTDRARAFARDWDGAGVPAEWVDRRELARHWSSPNPSVPSSVLLQAAWLGSARQPREQAIERVLQ
jgi:hypothetical protein